MPAVDRARGERPVAGLAAGGEEVAHFDRVVCREIGDGQIYGFLHVGKRRVREMGGSESGA